jgi:hypothetical protein
VHEFEIINYEREGEEKRKIIEIFCRKIARRDKTRGTRRTIIVKDPEVASSLMVGDARMAKSRRRTNDSWKREVARTF